MRMYHCYCRLLQTYVICVSINKSLSFLYNTSFYSKIQKTIVVEYFSNSDGQATNEMFNNFFITKDAKILT